METCPTCDRRVGEVYFLPPGIITKKLIESFDGTDTLNDLEICGDCLDEFS